jgi:hypothetical protein
MNRIGRKLPRRTLFLVLTLLISFLTLFSPGVLPVHAISPSFVKNVVGSQSSVTVTGLTAGDFLGLVVAPTTFASFSGFNTPTDTLGDTFSFTCGANANSCQTTTVQFWTVVKSSGSDTVSITCIGGGCTFTGGTMWADQYTNVASVLGGNYRANCGLANCPASGTDSLQSSITAGQGLVAWEPMVYITGNGAGTPSFTAASTTNDGINPAPQTLNHCQAAASGLEGCTYTSTTSANFPIFRVSFTGGAASASDDHADVLLLGGSSPTTTSNTSCYGNCGSPAVTLINANATHGINFNSSVTIFYAFQSPVNGFLLNMTTSFAKGFPNGEQVGLAAYVANCPVNVQPFTASCQGTAVSSATFFFGQKGRASITSNAPITAGEWIAIAFSAQFSGTDLNETNSVCSTACLDSGHLQYTTGFTPAILSGIARCASTGTPCNTAGIDATGLWAYITGTTVGQIPPPPTSGGCAGNFAQLDCLLPAMVNSWCNTVTASCQTGAALLWILILSIISFAVVMVTVGTSAFRFVGVGYIFVFCFLTWFFVFASFNLVLSFIVIMFLFVGAAVFAKSSRGTLGF